MNNKVRVIILAFLVLSTSTACAHSDGPYRGKVVELETGKPIEGAVVAARWTIEPFVHTERICDAKETLTDKNGEFELPKGSCTSHPFAQMFGPYVVVFKPGYLGYPPIGASQEERRSRMPDFTGREFQDKKQYYIIKLGKPKTREEKISTLGLVDIFSEDIIMKKAPYLLKLFNQEHKNLGFKGEIKPANDGD